MVPSILIGQAKLARQMKSLNKGFTLLELLFAAAILAFTLTGLLTLFISTIFLNEVNRNITIATIHAEHVMEEVKNTTYASIYPTYQNYARNGAAITTQWSALNNLLRNEAITVTTNVITGTAANPTLLDVSVTINWNDRGTRTRSPVILETYIAEP